jgi:hypothetical protein
MNNIDFTLILMLTLFFSFLYRIFCKLRRQCHDAYFSNAVAASPGDRLGSG